MYDSVGCGDFAVALPDVLNGRISERQIDLVKEAISKFRESEIDHLAISASEKEDLKSGWKQWLDATTRGIKDELRAEGKLGE